jgi:hypothetical protein
MRSQRSHYPVNWMDGMKINKDHFIEQYNATMEQLADSTAAISLSPLCYGVIPPSAAGENTYQVTIAPDNQHTVNATLYSLQAVTPGGFRIALPGLVQNNAAPLTAALQYTPSSTTTVYWLVVTIQPFQHVPSGSPSGDEQPPRYPFVQPAYALQFVNEQQYLQFAFNPYALVVGKVTINGSNVTVEEEYIPPCTCTAASADLVGLLGELDQFLSGLELRCAQVVQKILKKSQQNDLSELAMFLCDRIMLHIGPAITDLRWKQLHEPPASMFVAVVSIARIMKNTIDLRTGSGKEELLNYLSEWCELNQGELENMLAGIANLRYNHNDINSIITPIIRFVKIIGKLFESLSNLEFIGKRKESGIFVKEEHQYQTPAAAPVEQAKPKRRFFG